MVYYINGVIVLLLVWLVVGAWRLRHRRVTPGAAAAGMMEEMLNNDRRAAIEIIVDEKAAYQDPEDRDGNLPQLSAGSHADQQTHEHETWMRLAIEQAELARGSTGDNPWVGCVIISQQGELLGRGHTLGPGEDHAEIAAARDAHARGHSVVGATLYSTLEPCSFHGRTPACSKSIARRGIARVVLGIRDPHPRVNGAGTLILRNAGVEVVEGVCESEVRRQLGLWVIEQHPHEPLRRAQALPEPERVRLLAEIYGVTCSRIETLLAQPALRSGGTIPSRRAAQAAFGCAPDVASSNS